MSETVACRTWHHIFQGHHSMAMRVGANNWRTNSTPPPVSGRMQGNVTAGVQNSMSISPVPMLCSRVPLFQSVPERQCIVTRLQAQASLTLCHGSSGQLFGCARVGSGPHFFKRAFPGSPSGCGDRVHQRTAGVLFASSWAPRKPSRQLLGSSRYFG